MNCFKEFVDRLLKTASKIFRDPQAGNLLLHNCLMRMLMQLSVDIQPHETKTDLSGYIHLCAEIGPSYNQFGYRCCLQGLQTGNASSTKVKYKSSYERLSKN